MTKDIATRLRKCIEESRFTYAELEKKTGIAKSSIQRYASGVTKKIPIDAIQAIARALGVSPEYILGWESSENIESTGESESAKIAIGKRIKDLRIELNMTQEELAARCGYKSRSTINKIELGINDIPQSKINAFARALNTTTSYLIGMQEQTPSTTVTEDDIKVALFGGSGEVTDEMWQEVKNFAEFVKNKNKK